MSIIRNEKADQPASQSATLKNTQCNCNTKTEDVKDDYMISVPISVYAAGIRALATLSDITAIIAAEEESYINADPVRAVLGLEKGK